MSHFSQKNYHLYSREISHHIAWAYLPNVVNRYFIQQANPQEKKHVYIYIRYLKHVNMFKNAFQYLSCLVPWKPVLEDFKLLVLIHIPYYRNFSNRNLLQNRATSVTDQVAHMCRQVCVSDARL